MSDSDEGFEQEETTEYVTAMELEALVAHEMYTLFRKAGFEENQALKVIAFMMKADFDEVGEEEE